jgi:hypothetical protein
VLDRPYCDSIIISFNFKSEEQNPNININTSSILPYTTYTLKSIITTSFPHHTQTTKAIINLKSSLALSTPLTHQQSIYLSIQHCTFLAQPPTTKQTNKQTNTRRNNGLLNIHDSRATTPARQPSQSIPRQRAPRSTQRRGSEARRPQDRFRG